MNIQEIIQRLAETGARLRVDGADIALESNRTVDPTLVAAIKAKKSELVSELARVDTAATSSVVPDPGNRHEPFPLSDLQRAYIFGRNGAIPLGAISCDVYLEFSRPQLDPKRIEMVWNKLIARHEILRIVIVDESHQRILREAPWFRIPVADLTSVGAEEIDAALAATRERMCHQVHDVYTWPLYDIQTALLPGGTARIFVKFDLIGTDAASLYRILRELTIAYEGPDDESFEPPLISYRDYRLAEERGRAGPIWARDRQFWQWHDDAF